MRDLPRRRLGAELEVSAMGLGCMGMSEFYGPSDDAASERTIRRALDLGITLLDTADVYGPHTNEQLVGRAIRGRRDEAVVATKFGSVRAPGGAFTGVNGRPSYVRAACDASLARLGIDIIDLYYLHRVDPDVPIEETVGAMGDLVRAGKVRHIGLSEASAQTIGRAAREFAITAVQSEYSLWLRDVEEEVLPTCRELGIGFVAYSPLGRGFLTGAFRSAADLHADDRRRLFPRFSGDNFARNLRLVDALEEIARDLKCSASQLALAWLLARGSDIVPIPGTRSIGRLEENAEAVQLELSAQDVARIDDVTAALASAGERYPPAGMTFVERMRE
jgi:aryl-alcohol dehydrogenase-like predicted oxidoreductase